MEVNDFNHEVNLLEIARRTGLKPEVHKTSVAGTFKEAFSREIAKSCNLNFSKHARERLFSRGIKLSDEKLSKLAQAINKAADKGSRDTLILDNEAAYVASVPNRTIITAFSRVNLQEGIVTSIDSAVVI